MDYHNNKAALVIDAAFSVGNFRASPGVCNFSYPNNQNK